MQACEADTIDELTSTLNQLTADLVLLTNRSTNNTSAFPEGIVLLLEFIVK